jgi:SH3-like domain-containing protein
MTGLRGKGLWAYRKKELDRAIQIAPQMGATHILYKVGQGSTYYPNRAQAAQKITGAGLIPFGWTWLLLDDPQAEAQVVVRAFQDGFQGFVFDTESDHCRNRFEQAVQLGQCLRDAGIDFDRLYNCSFPNISHHRDLPYEQMNEYCKGGLMTMSYGTFFPPESIVPHDQQARRVIDEWTYGHYEYWSRRWGYRPPLYPILGPYHDEHGDVRMNPQEFQIWLDRLAAHRPAFFSVFTAAVINEDLLPLIHAFRLGEIPVPVLPSVEVEVVSPEVGWLNVRPIPSTGQPPITRVKDGAVVQALEPEADVRAKVGQEGQWLYIRTPEGIEGYVAAWYLSLHEKAVESGIQVEVVSPEVGWLNVRRTPSTGQPPITRVNDGAVLEALEPETNVGMKVGREGQWLRIRTPDGIEGYVAAWYLRLTAHRPPSFGVFTPEAALAGARVEVVSPEVGFLNVRPAPSTGQRVLTQVEEGDVLEALEPEEDVRVKVGQEGQWLHVRTPDGIEGYVTARYLRPSAYQPVSFGVFAAEAVLAGVQVEVVSPEVGFLRVRPTPSTEQPAFTQVEDGAVLEALEPEEEVRAKVGQYGQWLRIRTPAGIEGYVAAWYLRLHEEAVEAGVQVEVVSSEVGFLNVRSTRSTELPPIARVDDGVVLEALEPEEEVRAKVGQYNQWLRIRTPEGIEGYVAAWYLRLHEEVIGEPTPRVIVHSGVGLNVRQGAGTHTPVTWHVVNQTVLQVVEDPVQAGSKVGKDQWIKARTPSLHEGHVNGLYVRAKQLADKRQPVSDANLPRGESAWIFGIHAAGATTAADFRFLFHDKNKTGWVLFTEAIGADPHHSGGHDYTPWSHDGYGVIVRLNHGYEPAGTLPVRAKYADFAQACARYVQNSRGCHIWIIGNEQNNVREHPGGAEDPIEHITPQMYAEAFNLARRRIKQVQPEAVVVVGAVDPYNTYPWAKLGNRRTRPLPYFKEMLSHIDDLDGIALHTYTHWMDVSLITKRTVFQDEFLKPGTPHEHYYDFQAYRPFAEAIPAKWHDRPIYITESNHWVALEHQPRTPREARKVGWVNKDRGWVQAAYAEIHRWNNTPHVPQIHCLLIYRWTGDDWAIERLGRIHEDFKKALDHDYRWRR